MTQRARAVYFVRQCHTAAHCQTSPTSDVSLNTSYNPALTNLCICHHATRVINALPVECCNTRVQTQCTVLTASHSQSPRHKICHFVCCLLRVIMLSVNHNNINTPVLSRPFLRSHTYRHVRYMVPHHASDSQSLWLPPAPRVKGLDARV
jgi:Tfp pilus assembly protein PilX